MRKLIIKVYLLLKGLFGTKIEGTDNSGITEPVPLTWTKQTAKHLWDLFNADAQDKIDYTNTHADHHSNFKHLDDPEDERFDNVTEQVGLTYEKDGMTPFNAAEVYDMTYEEYEDYKDNILPIAMGKNARKITKEELDALYTK